MSLQVGPTVVEGDALFWGGCGGVWGGLVVLFIFFIICLREFSRGRRCCAGFVVGVVGVGWWWWMLLGRRGVAWRPLTSSHPQ